MPEKLSHFKSINPQPRRQTGSVRSGPARERGRNALRRGCGRPTHRADSSAGDRSVVPRSKRRDLIPKKAAIFVSRFENRWTLFRKVLPQKMKNMSFEKVKKKRSVYPPRFHWPRPKKKMQCEPLDKCPMPLSKIHALAQGEK